LELKTVFFARTVQKKHVENDWLSYHFSYNEQPPAVC
jgi:hypothetical protein